MTCNPLSHPLTLILRTVHPTHPIPPGRINSQPGKLFTRTITRLKLEAVRRRLRRYEAVVSCGFFRWLGLLQPVVSKGLPDRAELGRLDELNSSCALQADYLMLIERTVHLAVARSKKSGVS